MGVGPAVAIPAAVKSAGLEIEDIDLFELNEVWIALHMICTFGLPMYREYLITKSSMCRPLPRSLCTAATS